MIVLSSCSRYVSRRHVVLAFVVALAWYAGAGSGWAQDRPHYYVRFGDIAGSVQSPVEYQGWILAEDFSFSLQFPIDRSGGDLPRRGAAHVSDFSLVAKADIAAPLLMQSLLSGQVLPAVSFDERAYFADGPTTTGSWMFSNVHLTEISRIAPFRNRYSFSFAEFLYRFREADASGMETVSEMSWNVQTNSTSVRSLDAAPILSDINRDLRFDGRDIDSMTQALREGAFSPALDSNGDGRLDPNDRDVLIYELLGTVPGDADVDQRVDFTDFLTVSTHFGQPGGWAQGDFDGSGAVDFADYLAQSENFGITLPPNVQSVPEPYTLHIELIAWITGAAAVWRRRLQEQSRRVCSQEASIR